VNISEALAIVTDLASENVLTDQQAYENDAEGDQAAQLEAVAIVTDLAAILGRAEGQ
jgi:hypothetical protein